jgi:hypothetical protein
VICCILDRINNTPYGVRKVPNGSVVDGFNGIRSDMRQFFAGYGAGQSPAFYFPRAK